MLTNDFNALVESRVTKIRETLQKKASEYSTDDRHYNFKRAAAIQGITPEQALQGMMCKHLVSVLDLVSGKLEATEYMVNEKIGDMVNYLILLEALLAERRAASTFGISGVSGRSGTPSRDLRESYDLPVESLPNVIPPVSKDQHLKYILTKEQAKEHWQRHRRGCGEVRRKKATERNDKRVSAELV